MKNTSISETSSIQVGKWNKLKVKSLEDFGAFFEGGALGDIRMSNLYLPDPCEVGQVFDVFISLDSEDRLVATVESPRAQAGELACLKVVDVTRIGAFLDWGLAKDLLVPFREQKQNMRVGQFYIVYVYFDNSSKRLVASTKVHKYIDLESIDFKIGQEVDVIIGNEFELGYNVIINKTYMGVVYSNEIFGEVSMGMHALGYIKKVREDKKIDVTLHKTDIDAKNDLAEDILSYLEDENGFLPLTDKSPPEQIYDIFQVSKKMFKKTVGMLYKQGYLLIKPDGLYLIDEKK